MRLIDRKMDAFSGVLGGLKWGAYPPQEEPLLVVEEADDGRDDDGGLCIVGHVFEHRRQAQQRDHYD